MAALLFVIIVGWMQFSGYGEFHRCYYPVQSWQCKLMTWAQLPHAPLFRVGLLKDPQTGPASSDADEQSCWLQQNCPSVQGMRDWPLREEQQFLLRQGMSNQWPPASVMELMRGNSSQQWQVRINSQSSTATSNYCISLLSLEMGNPLTTSMKAELEILGIVKASVSKVYADPL